MEYSNCQFHNCFIGVKMGKFASTPSTFTFNPNLTPCFCRILYCNNYNPLRMKDAKNTNT